MKQAAVMERFMLMFLIVEGLSAVVVVLSNSRRFGCKNI